MYLSSLYYNPGRDESHSQEESQPNAIDVELFELNLTV